MTDIAKKARKIMLENLEQIKNNPNNQKNHEWFKKMNFDDLVFCFVYQANISWRGQRFFIRGIDEENKIIKITNRSSCHDVESRDVNVHYS